MRPRLSKISLLLVAALAGLVLAVALAGCGGSSSGGGGGNSQPTTTSSGY